DLLAAVALEDVKRDPAPVGAPVREEPRLLAYDSDVSAVGASTKKRIAGPRVRMLVAEQNRPVRPRKRRARRTHQADNERCEADDEQEASARGAAHSRLPIRRIDLAHASHRPSPPVHASDGARRLVVLR